MAYCQGLRTAATRVWKMRALARLTHLEEVAEAQGTHLLRLLSVRCEDSGPHVGGEDLPRDLAEGELQEEGANREPLFLHPGHPLPELCDASSGSSSTAYRSEEEGGVERLEEGVDVAGEGWCSSRRRKRMRGFREESR